MIIKRCNLHRNQGIEIDINVRGVFPLKIYTPLTLSPSTKQKKTKKHQAKLSVETKYCSKLKDSYSRLPGIKIIKCLYG